MAFTHGAALFIWLVTLLGITWLPLTDGVASWQRWGSSKGTVAFFKPGADLLQRGKGMAWNSDSYIDA